MIQFDVACVLCHYSVVIHTPPVSSLKHVTNYVASHEIHIHTLEHERKNVRSTPTTTTSGGGPRPSGPDSRRG